MEKSTITPQSETESPGKLQRKPSLDRIFGNLSEDDEDEEKTEKEKETLKEREKEREKAMEKEKEGHEHEQRDLLTVLNRILNPYLPNFEFLSISFPPSPLKDRIEDFFECKKWGSSIEIEIFAGIINFFSCMYCLPVIPHQMHEAEYEIEPAFATICLVVGIGTILSGLFTNTPLIIAPPTAVSIFVCSSLRSQNLQPIDGNFAVAVSGIAVFFLGIFGPIGRFITTLIPECIQASTTVGIGLLTALAGASEIELVRAGKYTLLEIGPITHEVLIALSGLILLGALVIHHSKVAYVISLAYGTILWWSFEDSWPSVWTSMPSFKSDHFEYANESTIILTFSLIFLIILTLFGLGRALCDLATITPPDGSIPRGRYLILIIGLCNIFSGLLYGPPIVISPETAGGIKAGARTGLSAIICGLLFLVSIFWGPFFKHIPPAGTTPLLLMIGLLLFMNIRRINFSISKEGIPAFCCLFFIPFTNSIICGLGIGYTMYILLNIFTLDLIDEIMKWIKEMDHLFIEEMKVRRSGANQKELMIPEDGTTISPLPISQNRKDIERDEEKEEEKEIKKPPQRGMIKRKSSIAVAREASLSFVKHVSEDVNVVSGINTPVI